MSSTADPAGQPGVIRAFITRPWREWIETLAVVLLTTASLATAWNSYQATQWSGKQSTLYSRASSTRVQATQAATNGSIEMLVDLQLFHDYAAAFTAGNTILTDYLAREFSPRLKPAVDAWRATDPLNNPDAPISPFVMKEYVVPNQERAAALEEQADDLFKQGVHANEMSGDYVLNSVFFALVLFFAGISSKVRGTPARAIIVFFGVGLLIYGAYHVFTLPVG